MRLVDQRTGAVMFECQVDDLSYGLALSNGQNTLVTWGENVCVWNIKYGDGSTKLSLHGRL